MADTASGWRWPLGFIGIALAALVVNGAVLDAARPADDLFGPAWTAWVFWTLGSASVLGALAAAVSFGVRQRWPGVVSRAFGISIALGWIVVLVATTIVAGG